jgi:MFS family permease
LTPFAQKYGVFETTGTYSIPSQKQSIGTGLGYLIAPWLCQTLGSKPTLLVIAGLLVVSIVLEAFAISSFWRLVVGRFIVYSGIELASNVISSDVSVGMCTLQY